MVTPNKEIWVLGRRSILCCGHVGEWSWFHWSIHHVQDIGMFRCPYCERFYVFEGSLPYYEAHFGKLNSTEVHHVRRQPRLANIPPGFSYSLMDDLLAEATSNAIHPPGPADQPTLRRPSEDGG